MELIKDKEITGIQTQDVGTKPWQRKSSNCRYIFNGLFKLVEPLLVFGSTHDWIVINLTEVY